MQLEQRKIDGFFTDSAVAYSDFYSPTDRPRRHLQQPPLPVSTGSYLFEETQR